jgi:hypothetical protein
MNQDRSPQEMILELYDLFSSFKRRIEDPNYIHIENSLEKLIENQNEMKDEIRGLKKQLLNPFDGVIVENKKNSEFRMEQEAWMVERDKLIEQHKDLVRWKNGAVKVLIALVTASGAVITFLLRTYLK